jgi:hypothetical protein
MMAPAGVLRTPPSSAPGSSACCAFQLQREGWAVTLIGRQGPGGEGTSYRIDRF